MIGLSTSQNPITLGDPSNAANFHGTDQQQLSCKGGVGSRLRDKIVNEKKKMQMKQKEAITQSPGELGGGERERREVPREAKKSPELCGWVTCWLQR